jgi:hypothetical protein
MLIESLEINDRTLEPSLVRVIEDTYVDFRPLLDREFKKCNRIYVLRADESSPVVGFFMVAFPTTCDGSSLVYLGLSAIQSDLRGSGLIQNLYKKFDEEICEFENRNGSPVLMWATTATPSALKFIHKLWAQAEPLLDGTYSRIGGALAEEIREQHFPKSPKSDHPFVIKQAVPDTLYSSDERSRIITTSFQKRDLFFEKLDIDERQGDRLLVICRTKQCAPQTQTASMF